MKKLHLEHQEIEDEEIRMQNTERISPGFYARTKRKELSLVRQRKTVYS